MTSSEETAKKAMADGLTASGGQRWEQAGDGRVGTHRTGWVAHLTLNANIPRDTEVDPRNDD
jgi:hypothetical protein